MRLPRIIPRFSLRTLVAFLLLVTSGFGLLVNWEAYRPGVQLSEHPEYVSFSDDGEYFAMITGDEVDFRSVTAGKEVRHSEVLTTREGSKLATLPAERWSQPDHWERWPEVCRTVRCATVRVSGCRMCDAILGCSNDGTQVAAIGCDVPLTIWRRRRPEWWWGVFWLWEFWLTAALAAIFVWSVVRDRRRLARTG